MKTTAKEIVDYLYTKYGTDSGILFGISEKAVVELIVQQTINKLQIYDADVNINSKLRKALEAEAIEYTSKTNRTSIKAVYDRISEQCTECKTTQVITKGYCNICGAKQ